MGPKSRTIIGLLVTAVLLIGVQGQGCTFPTDLVGDFHSSHETDMLTFNNTHVYPFWVDTQSLQFYNLTFECNFINGTQYIARSTDSISIYTVPYYVYSCWEFEEKTSDRYIQYQGTTKLISAANRNYKIYPIAYPVDASLICDVSKPYTGDLVSVLIKDGGAEASKTSCPIPMWGQYVYQLTDTTGSTFCDYTSYLDICTSTSTLSINTTLCADPTFYSTGGTLFCMFYLRDTSAVSTYYVYLYNNDTTVDDSTTYRFTCVVMKYTSSATYMTQYPGECLSSSDQNATYLVTSPGGLYTMYANVTCPPEEESTSYLAIIIACVVILLLIIIGCIIGGVYYYKKVYLPKKRDGRSSSKVVPDTLPNTAMSGMTADKNYRMMFTPAPPKSAVPGQRGGGQHADSGSRAVSAVSLRPTVSALATYRTPSPFISDSKDLDVDSLLDFDYTTKQRDLGDPDGAESGVMLEMEGSIPVYSEPGDTPEPTRITPVGNARRRLDSM